MQDQSAAPAEQAGVPLPDAGRAAAIREAAAEPGDAGGGTLGEPLGGAVPLCAPGNWSALARTPAAPAA